MRAKRRMAGLLAAGVTAALAGSGAVGASSALACTGTAILGQGSSLQKIAQETWEAGSNDCVKYTASGSAAGLAAWGVKSSETVEKSKDVYIGTDDAPNATQLEEIDKAASAELVAGKSKGQAIVIPVAQAAIAIIIKPPSGCTITQIDNVDLEKVFRAAITNWSQISTASGTCNQTITRVVREDGSGTTYQFKHYLFEIEKEAVDSGETWAQLQPETAQNLKWPSEGTVVRPTNKGGAEVVAKVKSEANSIGYANLGDAEAGTATTLEVQDNGLETGGRAAYAPPVKGSKEANCSVTYSPPAKSKEADADWSGVYGGNPSVASGYSICTLTWDVALKSASLAKLSAGEGTAAKTYLGFVVGTGQSEISKNKGYAKLSTALETLAKELVSLVG